jgi:hypothetical protein
MGSTGIKSLELVRRGLSKMRKLLLALRLAKPRKKQAQLVVRLIVGSSLAFGEEAHRWKIENGIFTVRNKDNEVIAMIPQSNLASAAEPITLFEDAWWR